MKEQSHKTQAASDHEPENILEGMPGPADMGRRLKKTRTILDVTLAQIAREAGISAGYISDFERGKKYPMSRYLIILAVKYNVNINYIFTGEGEMFIPIQSAQELLDFGNLTDDVKELLELMKKIPNLTFSVLQHLADYKVEKRHIIKTFLEQNSRANEP